MSSVKISVKKVASEFIFNISHDIRLTMRKQRSQNLEDG